jgi:hypothetical protein
MPEEVAQVVKLWSRKHEAARSIPSMAKQGRKKE